jgi:hypothetical protein
MAALFGESRWLGHAPESRIGDWGDVLADRSMDDIARALGRLQDSTPAHPPGAGDFRRLCAEHQPGTFSGGQPKPLPPVLRLLDGATVSGSAKAYIDMIRRVTAGELLTRAELAGLPPCYLPGGDMIRPVDYCTAKDDEHPQLEHQP